MMDPAKRIANWNVKYNTERIKATLDEKRPGMLASVTAVYPMITAMELQVKQAMAGRWLFMCLSVFSVTGPALIYWYGGFQAIMVMAARCS